MAARNVAVTSVFAGLSNPMWLSLICAKRRPPILAPFFIVIASCAWPRALPFRTPLESVHSAPVPTHAMQFKNPRRSRPLSSSCIATRASSLLPISNVTHTDCRARESIPEFPGALPTSSDHAPVAWDSPHHIVERGRLWKPVDHAITNQPRERPSDAIPVRDGHASCDGLFRRAIQQRHFHMEYINADLLSEGVYKAVIAEILAERELRLKQPAMERRNEVRLILPHPFRHG